MGARLGVQACKRAGANANTGAKEVNVHECLLRVFVFVLLPTDCKHSVLLFFIKKLELGVLQFLLNVFCCCYASLQVINTSYLT